MIQYRQVWISCAMLVCLAGYLALAGCTSNDISAIAKPCTALEVAHLRADTTAVCAGDSATISLKMADATAQIDYMLTASAGTLMSIPNEPGLWRYTAGNQPGTVEVRAYLQTDCGNRTEQFSLPVLHCQKDTDEDTENGTDSQPIVRPDPPVITYTGPRHVILFIGDGMGQYCETALSRYRSGTDKSLSFQQFPYANQVTTWDVNTYNAYSRVRGGEPYDGIHVNPAYGYDPTLGGATVIRGDEEIDAYFLHYDPDPENFSPVFAATDSASAATAMATGHKTDRSRIAWRFGDVENGPLETIAEQARKQGMKMGVVSSVPFSHATPASFVSHNTSRSHFQDIAHEIIFSTIPDVVISAGHPLFYESNSYIAQADYESLAASSQWVFAERKEGVAAAQSLLTGAQLAVATQKPLFGLYGTDAFANPTPLQQPGNPAFESPTPEDPRLADALHAALTVLTSNDQGFFLMVEGGAIDWSNHSHDYVRLLGTMHDFDIAIQAAVDWVNQPGDSVTMENTLIIVTADHDNGYLTFDEQRPLGAGELPVDADDERVTWGVSGHTNQLVHIYATGAGIAGSPQTLFAPYEYVQYPQYAMIDNTAIYSAMAHFLGLNSSPQP